MIRSTTKNFCRSEDGEKKLGISEKVEMASINASTNILERVHKCETFLLDLIVVLVGSGERTTVDADAEVVGWNGQEVPV
ncbi:hypothetical protein RB195_023284 [Necator americanus]|uniref:Uncharacterized protein n=1 Tax=Necator americanus TaxID=51031 RepID=A0ABR1EIT8_NECAM